METRYISLEAAEQVICDVCERPICPTLWGDACNSIDRLKSIPPAADVVPAPRWTSVEEGHPELIEQAEGDDYLLHYSKPVLVRRFGRYTEIAAFALEGLDEFWVDEVLNKISGVTHWMPLPEPPKEVQDGN